MAFALVFVGVVLLFSGFWVSPTGVIDHSVLLAFGEILTFVGALLGIDYAYQYKLLRLDAGLREIVREEMARDCSNDQPADEEV